MSMRAHTLHPKVFGNKRGGNDKTDGPIIFEHLKDIRPWSLSLVLSKFFSIWVAAGFSNKEERSFYFQSHHPGPGHLAEMYATAVSPGHATTV